MIRWDVLKDTQGKQKGGINPKLLNVQTYAHSKN